MDTPPQDQNTRRTTRSALAEIPTRLGQLSVSDTPSGKYMFTFFSNLVVGLNQNIILIFFDSLEHEHQSAFFIREPFALT